MASSISQPEFGRRLRQLRVARGLSQRDLAVGVVNPSYVSLLESGSRVPTLEVALQIARALDVPLSELIGDDTVAAGAESLRLSGERLVRDLLARSAADYGDLTDAAQRFAYSYQRAKNGDMQVAALQYGLALVEVYALLGENEQRYQLTVELEELAATVGSPELIIKINTEHASAARDTGRLAEALDKANGAVQTINGTQFFRSSQHVQLLSVLVSVLCDAGGTTDVPPLIEEMLSVAHKIDSGPLSGRAHWTASVAYARIGDARKAVEHIRSAGQMLANPTTPLRDWARFSRSAASALLDADADLQEVEHYLNSARAATTAADLPREAPLLASVEVRYALAAGAPERALELSEAIDEGTLTGFELVRLLLAKGRAMHRLGRLDEALDLMRRAAQLSDELAAYQLAAGVWRELDQMRTG